MKKLYKNILDNIQSIIKSEKNWIEEEFYREVVRNTFIINMDMNEIIYLRRNGVTLSKKKIY